MRTRCRRRRHAAIVVAGLMTLAFATGGCTSDGGGAQAAPGPVPEAGDQLDLAGVCPDPVVIQTGWYPQVERAAVYRLVGPGYKVDAARKRVVGPLVAEGRDTGVRVEVRSGGPAIGFGQGSAQLYLDRSILLADVPTDEAVQNSAAPRTTLAIRAGEKAKLAPCLARLVPIIQRAQVEFMADPKPTVDLILELNDDYGGGFVYSRGLAEHGVKTMRELGLVGNGPDRALGDFDHGRVQRVLDVVVPIFTAQKKPLAPGLRPEHLVTNDFIDPQVGLPAG